MESKEPWGIFFCGSTGSWVVSWFHGLFPGRALETVQAGRLKLDHYITHRFQGVEGALLVQSWVGIVPKNHREPLEKIWVRVF